MMGENTNDYLNYRSLLADYLTDYDIQLTDLQVESLIEYLSLVVEKTKYLNLTAVRDMDKGIILHIVDSLLYLKALEEAEARNGKPFQTFIDLGCGAGMPGIPLAIARPDLIGTLCDSTKKKIAAVDEFISTLGLSNRLSTSTERAEVLPITENRTYDVVTMRAVSSLPVLVEYASPLLNKRGVLIASKGNPEREEVASGSKAASIVGMREIFVRECDLPDGCGHRNIFVYQKVGNPKIQLPREIGMAKNHPLA